MSQTHVKESYINFYSSDAYLFKFDDHSASTAGDKNIFQSHVTTK